MERTINDERQDFDTDDMENSCNGCDNPYGIHNRLCGCKADNVVLRHKNNILMKMEEQRNIMQEELKRQLQMTPAWLRLMEILAYLFVPTIVVYLLMTR